MPEYSEDPFDSLHPDTPIYRIVDYFSFAGVVEDARLHISSAANLDDANEGAASLFGRLYGQASLFASSSHLPWRTQAEAADHHKAMRRRYYITCWTLQAESVAMWALYSQDHSSISMQTTWGKLLSMLDAYWREQAQSRVLAAATGDTFIAPSRVDVGQVRYRSLVKLTQRIERTRRAVQRLDKWLERRGEFIYDRWRNALNRNSAGHTEQLAMMLSLRPFLFKDESYRHEHEVRGIIGLGEVEVTDNLKDGFRVLGDRSHARRNVLAMAFSDHITSALPHALSIPIPGDFVESVRIDPRCPAYKREYMQRLLATHGIREVAATSFGYVADKIEIDLLTAVPVRQRDHLAP